MAFPQSRPLFTFLLGLAATVSVALGNVAPTYQPPAEKPTLRAGSAAETINLKTLFQDPDVRGSAVRVSVRIGTETKSFDLALYDQEKPITVANFLRYIEAGRAANTFFHRSVPGFVVQGGGFKLNSSLSAVETYDPIQNEPGISNVRGTIAMAKLGGNANSATSQWFVNLADNSANLDAQNGGFTVFGRVLGQGMAVVDAVAALQTYNFGSPFDSLPLKGYTSGGPVYLSYFVETSSTVVPTLSFTASSSDTGLLGVTVNGSNLQITPSNSRSGTATVTLTATDLEGGSKTATLAVDVIGWHALKDGSFTFDASADTVVTSAAPVSLGQARVGFPVTRTFTIRNNSSRALTGLGVSTGGGTAAEFAVSTDLTDGTLAAGQSATVTVEFRPNASGTRTASARIGSSDPNQPALLFALSGTGTGIPGPTLSAPSPQSLAVDASGQAVVPDWRGVLVTADDEAGVQSFTQSPAPGSSLSPGSMVPVVFTATNTAGYSSSVQTYVTVGFAPVAAPEIVLTSGVTGAPVPAEGSAGLAPNGYLTGFGVPAISNLRDLASRVTVVAGTSRLAAIYYEEFSGSAKLVARQNQPAPGTGAVFKKFTDPVLSPLGAIAFGGTLSGVPATEDAGVWTDVFGSLQPVLRERAVVPGLAPAKLKSVTSISLADDGLLALVKLLPGDGVVAGQSDTAIVRISAPGTGQLLARTGAPFENTRIAQLTTLQPAPLSPGQGRWHGGATVARLKLADGRTVLARLGAGGPQRLLQAGAADSGFPDPLLSLGFPAVGGSSVTVLATRTRGPSVTATDDAALLTAANGVNFADAVRENASAAGGGVFASFGDPVSNDGGDLLFYATLRGAPKPAENAPALWFSDGGAAPRLVARVGTAAKGAGGDPLTGVNWSAITSFALPDGEGAGPVFVAKVAGPRVKAGANVGLWATDADGLVRQILRTGEQMLVGDQSLRLTSFVLLNALPGSFGARRSYNASGSVAVLATFAGGVQAVLRVDLR